MQKQLDMLWKVQASSAPEDHASTAQIARMAAHVWRPLGPTQVSEAVQYLTLMALTSAAGMLSTAASCWMFT